MENINKYTIIDLLKKYKGIIGNELEDYLYRLFFDEIEKSYNPQMGIKNKNDIVMATLARNVDNCNNNTYKKITLVSEIYRCYSKSMSIKDLKGIKELIIGDKTNFAIHPYINDQYTSTINYEIITADNQQKVKSIHDDKTRSIISDIIDKLMIKDIIIVFKEKYTRDVYRAIMQNLYAKTFLETGKMSEEQFNSKTPEELEEIVFEDENLHNEFMEYAREFLYNNLQYINQEMLLMNIGIDLVYALKMLKDNKETDMVYMEDGKSESEEIAETVKFLRRVSEELNKNKYSEDRYCQIYNDVEIWMDKNDINKFLEKCTENDYVTEEEIKEIHEKISEGIVIEDTEKMKIANVNLDDLIRLMRKYETNLDEEQKGEILEAGLRLTKYLVENRLVENEELIEMYLQGFLDIDLISNMDMSELSNLYYEDKLKQVYYEHIYFKDNIHMQKKLERFSILYKCNMEKININNIVDEIIKYYGQDYTSEIVYELSKLNFIDTETAIKKAGIDFFVKQYENGEWEPTKVRKLYNEGKIDLDELEDMINKIQAENGEKYMIIGNIFPELTPDDEVARYILINECIEYEETFDKKNGSKKKRGDKEGPGKDNKKNITAAFKRINLIRSLDTDCSFRMTSNGYGIIVLKNLKKVAIEKLLDSKETEGYGNATYFFDEDYYELNIDRFEKNGKLYRPEVTKDKNSNKFIHSIGKWGTDIKEFLERTTEVASKWTEEEHRKIDEAIAGVIESKKELEQK